MVLPLSCVILGEIDKACIITLTLQIKRLRLGEAKWLSFSFLRFLAQEHNVEGKKSTRIEPIEKMCVAVPSLKK